MDISNIINALSTLINSENKNQNLSNANNIHTNNNLTKEETYNNQNEVKQYETNSNYNNFPPLFDNDTKQVKSSSLNMPIYPQATTDNPRAFKHSQNNTQNFSGTISNILSNPQVLDLIKQVLPMITNSGKTNSSNFLSNMLASFSKKNAEPQKQIPQEDSFDISSYIKIDDS